MGNTSRENPDDKSCTSRKGIIPEAKGEITLTDILSAVVGGARLYLPPSNRPQHHAFTAIMTHEHFIKMFSLMTRCEASISLHMT